MKKSSFGLLMLAIVLFVSPACKKSSGPTEANLVVVTTPVNGSNNLNVLGPDFPLKIEITSTMPPSGVKIAVTASIDGTANSNFFTASNTSTAPVNNYTITNTPSSVTCVVNITVTSVSKPSNVWIGAYRYSKK
jgi:hypothetical protein